MWERIWEIARKELKQTLREPRMRATLIVPPLVQLLVFGYAVNLDVEHVKIAWMDQDRGEGARGLLEHFEGSGRFTLVAVAGNEREAQDLLDRSRVDAVVRVLPSFSADLERGREAEVQVLVDGTNSNTASLVSAQCRAVVNAFSQSRAAEAARSRRARPGMRAETRVWFNPDLRSRLYFVPGILVNIIMLVTLTLTSMAIVREKEIGTMEQLMVTPIRPLELMLGKTLPFALIGLGQLVFISGVAMLVFQVPMRGDPALLVAASLLFLACSLGLGLLISTIANTQQQAMMMTLFVFQPAFMLSGFSFPIRNMPELVQGVTFVNPMRYFMEIVRGIFLKGAGLEVLWPQMAALGVLGFAILSISTRRFRKRLD